MMLPNVSPQIVALITSAANSPSAGSNASIATQIPSDTTALSGMLVHNYEALIAKVVEESCILPVRTSQQDALFDPFKEFYGEDIENVGVIDEVEEGTNTGKVAESEVVLIEEGKDAGKVAGLVCEAVTEKEEKVTVNVGNGAENAGTDADNVMQSKLNIEAMIEQAKHEVVDEYKRNTPYCQCDRALAAEKLVVGLPYEIVEDMCSSACKIHLIGIYKANRLLMTNENELKKTNKELKENESKFFVKLREALKENEHLKRSLLEKNCEINCLTEQVTLAEFETRKVKNKLEQWTISIMKREDLCKKQRGARIKTGSIAGLSGVNLTEVREEYAYGGSSGLGCSGSSSCSSFDSKKSVEDNSLINFFSSHVLNSDNSMCNSNLGCSTSNICHLNDDVIENVCGNDRVELSGHVSESQTKTNCFQKFFSHQIPSFTPVRISKPKDKESSFSSMNLKSEPDKVKVTTGKSKEPYDSYSDCNSQLSDCDEEIGIDRIPVSKFSKVGLKSHYFKCGNDDHTVKQCPEQVENSSKHRSLGRRLNIFVNKIPVKLDVEETLKEVRSIVFGICKIGSARKRSKQFDPKKFKQSQSYCSINPDDGTSSFTKMSMGTKLPELLQSNQKMINEAADLLLKGIRHGFKWTNISAIPPIYDSPDSARKKSEFQILSHKNLQEFVKWFYDNCTGEAIIRLEGEHLPEIRLFDPMEIFSFSDEDLKVLCENEIKHGAGDDTKTEANLFVRVANRARGVRAELRRVNEKIMRTDDLNLEMHDLSKQLDQSIEKRFEKPVEVEFSGSKVQGEKQTVNVQEEIIETDIPDTVVTEARFVESFLDYSESEEAGSEDVTNPLAGIKSRAGAFIENL
ncbi:hypothetical protein QVD17_11901 [Tagetes erecta]|uniref:Uncharacterized protein n=1 Tax=Tagetes erecta TaxID=13708 RepID=A0AAD8KYV6_TARER|nr:hypothetical protein QVD17_11901 [Tagetes erecta]